MSKAPLYRSGAPLAQTDVYDPSTEPLLEQSQAAAAPALSGQEVNVVDQTGKTFSIPVEQIEQAKVEGYRPESAPEKAARDWAKEHPYLAPLHAAAAGVARGVGLGGVVEKAYSPFEIAKFRAIENRNKFAGYVGEGVGIGYAGLVASGALGRVNSAAARAAGAAWDAAVGAELAVAAPEAAGLAAKAAPSLAKKLVTSAAGMGAENMAFVAPQAFFQAVQGDPDLAAETLTWGLGGGVALGIAGPLLGGAARATGRGLLAAAPKLGKWGDRFAFRSIGSEAAIGVTAKEAKHAGGIEAVGELMQKTPELHRLPGESPREWAERVEELRYGQYAEAVSGFWKETQAALENPEVRAAVGRSGFDWGEVVRRADKEVMAGLRGTPGFDGVAGATQSYLDSLAGTAFAREMGTVKHAVPEPSLYRAPRPFEGRPIALDEAGLFEHGGLPPPPDPSKWAERSFPKRGPLPEVREHPASPGPADIARLRELQLKADGFTGGLSTIEQREIQVLESLIQEGKNANLFKGGPSNYRRLAHEPPHVFEDPSLPRRERGALPMFEDEALAEIAHEHGGASKIAREGGRPLEFDTAWDWRRKLDQKINHARDTKDFSTEGALKSVRRIFQQELEAQAGRVMEAAGQPGAVSALKEANRKYALVSALHAGLEKNAYLDSKNALLSFRDTVFGSMAGAGAGLVLSGGDERAGLAGGILGMGKGIAGALAHKLVRERGNTIAARLLGGGSMETIERAFAGAAERLEQLPLALEGKLPRSPWSPSAVLMGFARQIDPSVNPRNKHEAFDIIGDKLAELSNDPARISAKLEEVMGAMGDDLPEEVKPALALHLTRLYTELGAAMPKKKDSPNPLEPSHSKFTDSELSSFAKIIVLGHDPIGGALQFLNDRTLGMQEAAFLKKTNPALHRELAMTRHMEYVMSDKARPLSYSALFKDSLMTGAPMSRYLAHTKSYQSAYVPQAAGGTAAQQKTPTKLKGPAMMSESLRIETRSSQ